MEAYYLKTIQKPYADRDCIRDVIRYVTRPSATEGNFVGSEALLTNDPNEWIQQFWDVKRVFFKTEGRLLHHYVLSFPKRCVIMRIIRQLCR